MLDLQDKTIPWEEFYSKLLAHSTEGILKGITVKNCTITDIPKEGVTIFKIKSYELFGLIPILTLCNFFCGFEIEDSKIHGNLFKSIDGDGRRDHIGTYIARLSN